MNRAISSRSLQLTSLVAALIALSVASPASADGMDLALSRLRVASGGPTCASVLDSGNRAFCPDDAAWRRTMSQLGASFITLPLTGARTTGSGGFALSIEASLAGVSGQSEYWQRATEGGADAATEGRNRSASEMLLGYRVRARKGLGFGLQIGSSFGHTASTGLFALGLELQWSPFEGFRTGGGVFPDVAFRGSITTVVGDGEYNLSVPTFEVILSKPITVASGVVLTPLGGFQIGWIFADSELVDLTPDVDAYEQCNPDPSSTGLSCRGSRDDFNNAAVFPRIRVPRYRVFLGLETRVQAFYFNLGLGFDLLAPGEADSSVPGDLPRQWNVALAVGLTR